MKYKQIFILNENYFWQIITRLVSRKIDTINIICCCIAAIWKIEKLFPLDFSIIATANRKKEAFVVPCSDIDTITFFGIFVFVKLTKVENVASQ